MMHAVALPLSIIIPTYRRAEILRECLHRIARQTAVDQLEVIVVSDGEDAQTTALFEHHPWQFPLRFLTLPKCHQGVARNRGVALAEGKVCLFIGDDIFLEPEAGEKHLERHSPTSQPSSPQEGGGGFSPFSTHTVSPLPQTGEGLGVLGFTTWDPSMEITSVMRWLEATGWQFGYPLLEPYRHAFIPRDIQHRFTYTSHISVPTAIAKRFPFREDVALYGWEDIEWGMRLRDAGVELFYEPDAMAYHHHPMTLEQSLRRMETLGTSAIQLAHIAPSLDRVPRGWKLWAYRMIALLPTMRGKHAKAFLRGISQENTQKHIPGNSIAPQ